MTRARRSVYLLLHPADGASPDFAALLRGTARPLAGTQVFALSILTGDAHPLSGEELERLLAIPSDRWVDVPDDETVERLTRCGLLVVEGGDGEVELLRLRDERLGACGWNLYAALYHFLTRWRDVDLRTGDEIGEFPMITEAALRAFVAERGIPPAPFHSVAHAHGRVELPLARGRGGLYDALAARKTTRGYDRTRSLDLEQLALVLYEVWGCHGTAPIVDELFALRRTSPSGGGMHPVEVYPLVVQVDGVEPGLYHYASGDHVLEQIQPVGGDELGTLATDVLCGQAYLASAHVLLVMTARFDRLHWKYRKHQKAYGSALMDAAHLSQTLYLVCADLGLGSFVTLAFNSSPLEELLAVDGVGEGVVAVAGCGPRRPERSPFEPDFEPYVPSSSATPCTRASPPGSSRAPLTSRRRRGSGAPGREPPRP
jgi:putative peptide maturation dehydrogenase